nr:WAS/WASL-interacting protein family member 3-like [Aegilops tauschii subsp. strangulata]
MRTPTPLFYPCPARPSELPNYALARAAPPLTSPLVALPCARRSARPSPCSTARTGASLAPSARGDRALPGTCTPPACSSPPPARQLTPLPPACASDALAHAPRLSPVGVVAPPVLLACRRCLPPTRPLAPPRPPAAALLPLL